KMFLKLYHTVGEQTMFIGVVAIEPPKNSIEGYDFIDELEDWIQQDISFKPTTLEAYMDFQLQKDFGDVSRYRDLQTQNISC
ncbi:MAG: hypothetical protein KAH32_05580, partial [Chlamydiia bacterium]|nr:hypothetical protein [Chlamydiia bacterium]